MRETQRLDKLLSNFGYGSRKEIKEVIKAGQVKIDGQVTRDVGAHVDPKQSKVEICGETLNYRENIYVLMNKPEGVISATYDNKLRTVIDILPREFKCFDLFPVGRLDIDTLGLLILTNDGQLAHELLSPKKHVPKRYYAHIDGQVTEADGEAFKAGVVLEDGYKTLPAELFILKSGEQSEIELVIYEGKFHQVKRMFEAVGKKVTFLQRIEMGPIRLPRDLAVGECREMAPEQVELLKEAVQ